MTQKESTPEEKKKTKKSSHSGKPSFLRKIILLFLLVVCASIAVISVWGALFVREISEELPTTTQILAHKESVASTVYDRDNQVIARLFTENRKPVQLKDVSPWMIKCTLAAEDSSFYQHSGIRLPAIVRALMVDILHRGARQGGSTITQQLARNLFLTHEKTIKRKAKEIMLAIRMEQLFSKDKILEMYLNTIYFGHGAWGVETASKTYFGKEVKDLNLHEAAVMAGLIAAPERYSPLNNMGNAKKRQGYVLGRLVDLGWINSETRDAAYKEEIVLKHTPNKVTEYNRAPYFVAHLLFNYLLPKYGADLVYSGGMEIHTTLDLDLQEEADASIQTLKSQGALIAMDPLTGEVLAMTGGKDFSKSKFNRVTQAYRQPGSAFKPFVFAAALEKGILPTDHFLDAPLSYDIPGEEKKWEPGNYSNKYNGEVTVLDALIHSYNTVAVRMADLIGVTNVVHMARSAGITSPHLPYDLSLALGTASITPMEMAVAFSTFANGGHLVSPFMIREIRSSNGDVLEFHTPEVKDGISPTTAVVIRSLMEDVVQAGTGRRARIPGWETFGKTGTTNDYSDAWFAGGVPGLVTIVYAGNDDHKPLGRNATGSAIAVPVWKRFMEKAVKVLHLPQSFDIPEGLSVEAVQICRESGFLASPNCPAATIFLPTGSIPTTICPLHGGELFASQNDPQAPRLYLLPQDEEHYYTYATFPNGNIPWTFPGTEGTEPGLSPLQKQPIPSQKPAEESNVPTGDAKPYENDPSPAKTIEDRYQDLLKQYGITN
ncbi:MAG: PBP1A family penicillin-binding protein [Aminobacterium sp.]|uniref:penicillin-binding protein 1A n=1 Tax=Aminobacterium sp. TaxID=1872491 RepID=UPI002B1ED81D|nr:PBP1A family penicillin-binding protein [Aminobacterium sp.]MEA4878177.1 PBP1A family penicillin-binding protein [Aminobacterium sp.]